MSEFRKPTLAETTIFTVGIVATIGLARLDFSHIDPMELLGGLIPQPAEHCSSFSWKVNGVPTSGITCEKVICPPDSQDCRITPRPDGE